MSDSGSSRIVVFGAGAVGRIFRRPTRPCGPPRDVHRTREPILTPSDAMGSRSAAPRVTSWPHRPPPRTTRRLWASPMSCSSASKPERVSGLAAAPATTDWRTHRGGAAAKRRRGGVRPHGRGRVRTGHRRPVPHRGLGDRPGPDCPTSASRRPSSWARWTAPRAHASNW